MAFFYHKVGEMKYFFAVFIIVFTFKPAHSQEFRGLDIRVEPIPDNPSSSEKNIYLDLYMKSPDTIQMDSFLLICSWYDWVMKQEHLFFEDNIQLLRFFGTAIFTDFTGHLCWTFDTIYIEGINNYNGGNLTPIQFGTEYVNFAFNSDPVYNSLQTEVEFNNGLVTFDASGTDPNGQNLGYFLHDNFEIGTYEGLYQKPAGAIMDSLTGELSWTAETPGKYLFIIGYSQSFSNHPPSWNISTKRYMIIEVKEEDVLSLNENNPSNNPRNKIIITPNPATSRLIVQIEQSKIEKTEIILSITNLIGQNMYIDTFQSTANKISKEINVGDWTPGVYMLILQTSDGTLTEKITVQ